MNYIETLNQFWQLRRRKRITNLQADLYFFLLNESSSRGVGNNWENPFQCSNGIVCTSIGITEKSLIDARNVLQQLGLIDSERGITKQKAPTYYLREYWNKVSNQGGIPVSIPVSNQGGNEGNINRNKRNQTKRDETSGESPGEKKTVESTMHWKSIVETWFVFYKKNFQIDPSFNGAAAKNLKTIVDRIEKAATKAGNEWTEEYALSCLNHFFLKAISDEWLKQNFLLNNLASKFDAIIQKSNGVNQAKQSGANVSTASAFSKIDRMSD